MAKGVAKEKAAVGAEAVTMVQECTLSGHLRWEELFVIPPYAHEACSTAGRSCAGNGFSCLSRTSNASVSREPASSWIPSVDWRLLAWTCWSARRFAACGGPVPTLREKESRWQHCPSDVSGMHDVVNPGDYLEDLVCGRVAPFSLPSMGTGLSWTQRWPSNASGLFVEGLHVGCNPMRRLCRSWCLVAREDCTFALSLSPLCCAWVVWSGRDIVHSDKV